MIKGPTASVAAIEIKVGGVVELQTGDPSMIAAAIVIESMRFAIE